LLESGNGLCSLSQARIQNGSVKVTRNYRIMKLLHQARQGLVATGVLLLAANGLHAADDAAQPPPIPRFSIDYLDRTVKPDVDFYHFACGTWLKNNPVPADKSRWAAFDMLAQRNWFLMRDIAESAAADTNAPAHSPAGEVGAFYASVMDTNKINELGLKPLEKDFARIAALKSADELVQLVADFQLRGVGAKNSAIYALQLGQGGLGLPDRDYYLTEGFAKQRAAYVVHITKMLKLAGESETEAATNAGTILSLETEMAKASKSRTDLRDPVANYHKLSITELDTNYPSLDFKAFRDASGIGDVSYVIVGQPEYFAALEKLVKERPLEDWKIYLKWHVLHNTARYLSADFENESFAFYSTELSGQPAQEPRWQRAAFCGKVLSAVGAGADDGIDCGFAVGVEGPAGEGAVDDGRDAGEGAGEVRNVHAKNRAPGKIPRLFVGGIPAGRFAGKRGADGDF
jgi:putative endopeptidase